VRQYRLSIVPKLIKTQGETIQYEQGDLANLLPRPNYGLPPARHVLLAGNLKAFTDEGDEIVAHGGIALEEVMVPFVAITRDGA
jgi:hypothetical protein